jgi:hypothetical protein
MVIVMSTYTQTDIWKHNVSDLFRSVSNIAINTLEDRHDVDVPSSEMMSYRSIYFDTKPFQALW